VLTTVWRNGWGSASYYSFVVGSSAVGQGVATAHMADHCMGAALYAQKALKLAGKSFEDERNWQLKKLEDLDLKEFRLLLSNREKFY